MKDEVEQSAKRILRGRLAKIKSETEKIMDEAINLIDERERKKIWSGYDSIPSAEAPENVIPGCLVLEGGAFRGCYTSGVLDVLMENGINLQTTIGTSAGALNGFNYAAGEIGRAAKINLGYRHDHRYFSPRTAAQNHGVVGFNFILNAIEDEMPFNWERFNNPIRRLIVTVTNCITGETLFCEKGITPDFPKAVQASASMPFVSEMVNIDGVPCLDGGCSDKIPYQWALDQHFEKILVIRTRPRAFRRNEESPRFRELTSKFYHNYPNLVELLNSQSVQYNTACDDLELLEKQGAVKMLCPSGSIAISTLEGDMEKLGALYLLGRCDAQIMLPEIKRYFNLE